MDNYIIYWTWDSLPSKKNSKRIVSVRWRPMLLSSKEYLAWENLFIQELKTVEKPWEFRGITCRIWAKDKRKFDLSNKWESIADALVKAEYIEDDNMIIIPSITLEFMGYSVEKKWAIEIIFVK